jgi:hypothetical protein
MDVGALATIYAGVQASKVQMAAAAKMMKMNAQAQASILQVLEAAQDNMQKVAAATAAGVGGNLDISV